MATPARIDVSSPVSREGPGNSPWPFVSLLGRWVEISSTLGGCATAAMMWLVEAQARGETGIWVASPGVLPFADDVVANGVSLSKLLFVTPSTPPHAAWCIEEVVKTQSSKLVVWDTTLTSAAQRLTLNHHARLGAVLHQHKAVLISLTRKTENAQAESPRVSLRVHLSMQRGQLMLRAIKDKHAGPGATYSRWCHVPSGMC